MTAAIAASIGSTAGFLLLVGERISTHIRTRRDCSASKGA